MDGDYLSLDDLEDTPSLSEMLEEILKEEEKEKAKPPKEPKTQKEKCAGGRHGRIVECGDGDMCSACGRIAYYYLK